MPYRRHQTCCLNGPQIDKLWTNQAFASFLDASFFFAFRETNSSILWGWLSTDVRIRMPRRPSISWNGKIGLQICHSAPKKTTEPKTKLHLKKQWQVYRSFDTPPNKKTGQIKCSKGNRKSLHLDIMTWFANLQRQRQLCHFGFHHLRFQSWREGYLGGLQTRDHVVFFVHLGFWVTTKQYAHCCISNIIIIYCHTISYLHGDWTWPTKTQINWKN